MVYSKRLVIQKEEAEKKWENTHKLRLNNNEK